MSFGKVSIAIATAIALVSTPALAAGQSVRASSSALSTKSVTSVKADARMGSALGEANAANGGKWIIVAGGFALIVGGIIIAFKKDDNPTSP